MKTRVLSLVTFIASLSILYGQNGASCAISPNVSQAYKKDIANLAIRRMYEVKSSDTSLITIPQSWIDTIAGDLSAIYTSSSAERDTVMAVYCIHDDYTFQGYYGQIIMQIDTNYSWTQAWKNNVSLTGNALIDSLMVRYNITINGYLAYPSGTFVVLDIDSILNTYALIENFNTIGGILNGEPSYWLGDGNSIGLELVNGERIYTFKVGYGDCPSGCINSKSWLFRVEANCNVVFVGREEIKFGSEPFPAPVNCENTNSIEEEVFSNVSMYPNPTNHLLTIDGIKGNCLLQVFSMDGKCVLSNTINNLTTIDVSFLRKGIYVVSLTNKKEATHTQKIQIQ